MLLWYIWPPALLPPATISATTGDRLRYNRMAADSATTGGPLCNNWSPSLLHMFAGSATTGRQLCYKWLLALLQSVHRFCSLMWSDDGCATTNDVAAASDEAGQGWCCCWEERRHRSELHCMSGGGADVGGSGMLQAGLDISGVASSGSRRHCLAPQPDPLYTCGSEGGGRWTCFATSSPASSAFYLIS
jgi:hypothetical protein